MQTNWVDVDWSLRWIPTEEQREQSLQRMQFRPIPVTDRPILQLVNTFRALLTNGGAHVASFALSEDDDVAAWCLSRHRDEYRLAERLITSAAFADALPAVTDPGLIGSPAFVRSHPLILDGTLARALQWGGAYSPHLPGIPGNQAKTLASAFCASLFDDRYDDIDVDDSSSRWSNWFEGIAWDRTWVITDKRHHHMTALCITDTD